MASETKKAKLNQSSSAQLVAQAQQAKSIGHARQFLKEVSIEFNKITWPGRAQVIQETYSVLFLVTIITLMVLSFDWFLGKAIFGPLEYWARLHGGGVGHG
jgi:preprotein translocase SecE subunit